MNDRADNGACTELASVGFDVLSKPQAAPLLVGELALRLEQMFDPHDAEPWDHTGLLVGDPSNVVTKVAIALDPTVDAIKRAAAQGCNVLITHHPAFLQPPELFRPPGSGLVGPSASVWQAVAEGVSLMCFHTALDANPQAHRVLPAMLSLQLQGILEPLDGKPDKGYGQLCSVATADEPLSLAQLAARCMAVFGRLPRVWGAPDARLARIVTATGSGGGLVQKCVENSVDCLVCGEVRYHDSLAALECGLALVELGHDVSEAPLCAVLAAAAGQVGVPESSLVAIDQSTNWWTPEATRR